MTSIGAKYKSDKYLPSRVEEKNYCDIIIEPREQSQNIYHFSVTFQSKAHTYKKPFQVRAASKGQSSLKIVNEVIKHICENKIPYKNVNLYFESDYAVKIFHEVGSMIRSGSYMYSPNLVEIGALYDLKKLADFSYYLTLKKSKQYVYGFGGKLEK